MLRLLHASCSKWCDNADAPLALLVHTAMPSSPLLCKLLLRTVELGSWNLYNESDMLLSCPIDRKGLICIDVYTEQSPQAMNPLEATVFYLFQYGWKQSKYQYFLFAFFRSNWHHHTIIHPHHCNAARFFFSVCQINLSSKCWLSIREVCVSADENLTVIP